MEVFVAEVDAIDISLSEESVEVRIKEHERLKLKKTLKEEGLRVNVIKIKGMLILDSKSTVTRKN